MSLAGVPFTGQAVPGMKAARSCSAASARNVGRRVPITAPAGVFLGQQAARGRALGDRNREARSTGAEFAGGPARSSAESPVMGEERRGRLI